MSILDTISRTQSSAADYDMHAKSSVRKYYNALFNATIYR